MKRRLFCLLLAFVLLLLCGCSDNESQEPAQSASDYCHQKVMERMEKVQFRPPYEGKPLLEYDPDCRVYISLGGLDLDLYPDTSIGYSAFYFWVISLDPFSESEIRVEIPVQTEYTVSVLDASQMCHGTIYHDEIPVNFGLTEQQYMCMAGVDFQERQRQAMYATICNDLLLEFRANAFTPGMTPEQIAQIKASEQYQFYLNKPAEYLAKYNEASEQYKVLPKEELPQFYAYRVGIQFTGLGSHAETVETLTVTVGPKQYEMEIGQCRLHTQTPLEYLDHRSQSKPEGMSGGGGFQFKTGYFPSPSGYDGTRFVFTAKEDLTVTGAHLATCYGDKTQIQDGYVEIYKLDKDGNEVLVLNYLWDTRSPLYFEEGQIVHIQVSIQDDRLKEYHVGFGSCIFLDYTYRGKAYTVLHESRYYRDGHPWDIYLMVFEGVDVGEWYYYEGSDGLPPWHQDASDTQ